MVEIQQLIVKAKINSGELEDQNIVQTVNSIIENYLKSKGVVKAVSYTHLTLPTIA